MSDGGRDPDPAGEVDQLRRALASRTEIGIAIGIVMERYSVDREHAFARLSRISQESTRRLRDIAADVSAGRDVPGLRVERGGADT